MFAYFYFFFGTKNRFFKSDGNIKAQVRSGLLLSTPSAKKVTEYIAKLGEDIFETTWTSRTASF
jgi:hypothetical protein